MLNIILSSFTAFIITFLAIPSIIRVAVIKNLYDEPGERKLHHSSIPTLGGLAIFAGVVFSYTFWSSGFNYQATQYIIAAITLLFFIGIKDDIVELSPTKKIIGQIIAASILVFFGDIRITGLYGIFGVYEVPYWFSAFITVFTILVVVNAFNLIDGVDGLAAGIGAIASFTFGLWFYNYNQIALCILAFTLFSSLLAFLIYNFSPATIFMGDTGSLIIGLILSLLAINFIELSFESPPYAFPFRSSPAMAIAILIIPLLDTFRIFIVRLWNNRSPFKADKNHLHHILLSLGLSHREVSMSLYIVNIGFILLALSLRNISSLFLLIIICSLALVMNAVPFILRFYAKSRSYSLKAMK